ncbi:MAG: acyltransferase family protein [Candidatus Galacturonibacter soehngenii]|nr:acyltransferase family protein [Candidatus Galacturonibacter soehngenii]
MERLKWVDVSKGSAIFLVIVGHSCEPDGQLARAIFSFHMPFFFFIAGYLFKDDVTFPKLIIKKSTRLLLPYFCTMTIVFLYWYSIERHIMNDINSPQSVLISLAKIFILGSGVAIPQFKNIHPVGGLWFVACLFLAEVIFYSLIKTSKKLNKTIQWVMVIVFCLSGYIISRFTFLPWSADIALFAQIFLFIGFKFRENDVFNKKIPFIFYSIMFFLWVVSWLNHPISMNNRDYYNVVFPIIGAIIGCVLFIKSCIKLSKIKFIGDILSYLGQISIVILAFHVMDVANLHFNTLRQLEFLYKNHDNWALLSLFRLFFSIIITEMARCIPLVNKCYGLTNPIFNKYIYNKSKICN